MYFKKFGNNLAGHSQGIVTAGADLAGIVNPGQKRKTVSPNSQKSGAGSKKPMKRIMKIEDLPDDFDESIYQNEYDGKVQQIISEFRVNAENDKREQYERQRMQRYLNNKEMTKLGLVDNKQEEQTSAQDYLGLPKTNMYGIPENKDVPSITHTPNRLSNVGKHYSRVRRPSNQMNDNRVTFLNVDSDR